MAVLPGFQTGFDEFGEPFEGRCTAERAGRHRPVRLPAEPTRSSGQSPAQRGSVIDVAHAVKVSSERERVGGIADRFSASGGDEVVDRQGRVQVAMGIVEVHDVLPNAGDHQECYLATCDPGAPW
jgi:hypothetical protein